MNGTYIRSSRPFFPKEDIDNITKDISSALSEGKLRNGPNIDKFEKKTAEYLGVRHCIALDSDSSALETALQFYGVKNREVIVCTNSFISVPNSVMYAGGKPVFADIRKETLSMDPKSLKEKISDQTAAVILTHIAGFPNPDLTEIKEACASRNLRLVEDASHAIGATFAGQKVGSFGDAAVFAFTPTKVLTTGEGGMLATNDSGLADYARLYRYYGSGMGKTDFESLGRHMMLPEISAVLGVYQLSRLEEFVAKRNQVAKMYNETFDPLPEVNVIKCPKQNRSSYYKYPLTLSPKVNKEKFVKNLSSNGIETGTVFYPPCHMQPVYKKSGADSSLPNAEDALSRTITLPMHAALTDQEVAEVIRQVKLSLDASLC